MVDHLKTGETLGVSGDKAKPEAVAKSLADIKTAVAGVEIPAGAGQSDRRVHFGISGVAGTVAKVKSAAGVEEAKGYPGSDVPNYRPFPDPPFDGTVPAAKP